jgi:hypothetical protein
MSPLKLKGCGLIGRSTLSLCHPPGEPLRLREVGCTLPVDFEPKCKSRILNLADMNYFRLVLLFPVLVSALPTPAQNKSCLRRIVPVTVMDSAGRPILGFAPADFQAKFRGKPVKILSIIPDDRPRRIVILLDTSGSMSGEPRGRKWEIARAIAVHLVDAHLPNTSLALFFFSDQVHEQIGFSDGTPAIAKRLLDISANPDYVKKSVLGKTALYDAVLAALHLLDAPGFSDSIYLISDGGDNNSRSKQRDVRRALVSSGVRLHASVLAPTDDRVPEDLLGLSDITEMTTATGGVVLGPVGRTRAPHVMSFDLNQEERQALSVGLQYLEADVLSNVRVELELPETPNKWGEWSLELSHEKQKQFKHTSIAYPRDLAPCSALPK